jgi:hypothetical protein
MILSRKEKIKLFAVVYAYGDFFSASAGFGEIWKTFVILHYQIFSGKIQINKHSTALTFISLDFFSPPPIYSFNKGDSLP